MRNDIHKSKATTFAKLRDDYPVPDLVEIQTESFHKMKNDGLLALFKSISPIESIVSTAEEGLILEFLDLTFDEPKYEPEECKRREKTFEAGLKVRARLINRKTGEIKEQEVYLSEFPMMTDYGTFVFNGAERVVLSQLIRSPGVYFSSPRDVTGINFFTGKIIPNRGAWVEFEFDIKGQAYIRIDKTRKIPITTFLRAIGFRFVGEARRINVQAPTREKLAEYIGCDLGEDLELSKSSVLKKGAAITEKTIEQIVKIAPRAVTIISAERITLNKPTRGQLYGFYGCDLGADIDAGKAGVLKKGTPMREAVINDILANKVSSVTLTLERRLALEKPIVIANLTREKLLGFTLAAPVELGKGGKTLEAGTLIDEEKVQEILRAGLKNVSIVEHIRSFYLEDSIMNTLAKETALTQDQALLDIYKKLRPGDIPTVDHAERLLDSRFFQPTKYDLSAVGRYKINQKLNIEVNQERLALTRQDFVEAIRYMLALRLKAKRDIARAHFYDELLTEGEQRFFDEFVDMYKTEPYADDIDHLGNRRVRSVGELLLNRLRGALGMMEKTIRDRMIQYDAMIATPQSLINPRPLIAAINEFFGSSPLSQFMDQTNPLSALTHKRKLSALGPGGLTRERAGFEVRDVHHSHYGRICPIESPEGPNIGLIGSLATHAKVDKFGFLLTPYRKVVDGKVTDTIEFLNASQEDRYAIAQANETLDKHGAFTKEKLAVRLRDRIERMPPSQVQYMDVSPKQLVSVTTSLIPFLEHNDANRALMGSNMQRQAVPLIASEAPLVGTGMERKVAVDAGAVLTARRAGVVTRVDSNRVVIAVDGNKKEEDSYPLIKYSRSNQSTCINFKPRTLVGDKVEKGDVLADGPNCENGRLALGRNLLVAFMPWEGYNFEDAIVVSERLLKDDIFTSIYIEKYDCEARETKLGPEEITRDIPNVNEEVLENLDDDAIVKIGTFVKSGDILIGKVIPKGETEPTAEERLLRAIFGEKARDVRNTSLKVPHGGKGFVISVTDFNREHGDDFAPGKNRAVRVFVAQKRRVQVGDKLASRHGNKGVISKIVPREDMPFLDDGTPIDVLLNPLGVPSRMNLGQILETHLGWAARKLNSYCDTAIFDGASEEEIIQLMKQTGLPADGKVALNDGKTGQPFDEKVTVGYIYLMKLNHMVEDKMHARSTGSYALVTQQPLGGKAQFGGQRFGEMEVWALEAYGAAVTLQELLTIKSDDITGRVKTYEAIVKGENISKPGIPESFNVLVKELQALALDVTLLSGSGRKIQPGTNDDEIVGSIMLDDLGISTSSF